MTKQFAPKAGSANWRSRSPRRRHDRQRLLSTTALATGRIALVLAIAGCVWTQELQANPKGGQVVGGSARIVQTSPQRLDIHQSSDRAIIDWQSFSIAQGEHTNFVQPSKHSMTLNRVVGGDLSTIAGRLSANGNIAIINPSGILFTKTAQVDVHGLIATTSNIGNRDFMAGRLDFSGVADPASFVINHGSITAAEGGLVALVAPWVENSGMISARLGRVALASGDAFTVDLYGDRLIQLAVPLSEEDAVIPAALSGNARVTNAGSITADGGLVALTVADAQQMVSNVINMDGVVEARSVAQVAGRILLDGGAQGVVSVSGSLDASGRDAGESGGQVAVLGEKVGLFEGARVDVSGDLGGGTALIGGNFQGAGPEPNAAATYVAAGAAIHADAISEGKGGTAIVWADEGTRFEGTLTARGGAAGGDGGFAEVSGKETLTFWGNVDVSAPGGGLDGTLLLDPHNIRIVSGDASSGIQDPKPAEGFFLSNSDSASIGAEAIIMALKSGDVVVQTGSTGVVEDGDIVIETMIKAPSESGDLTLLAHNDILFRDSDLQPEQSGAIDFSGTAGKLELEAKAGSIVNESSADSAIVTGSGGAALSAGGGIGTSEKPLTIGDNSRLAAEAFGGGIFVASEGSVTIGEVKLSEFDVPAGLAAAGDIFVAAKNIVVESDLSAAEGGVQLTADSKLTLNTVDEPPKGNGVLDIFAGGTFIASGMMTLESDASIETDGAEIRIAGDITGTQKLSLSTGVDLPRSDITLEGNVGVADLSILARTTKLEGTSYGATANFVISGNTQLVDGSSVEITAGSVVFVGDIEGAADLKIVSGSLSDPGDETLGRVSVSGNIGGTKPLAGLEISAEEIFLNSVATDGAQSYASRDELRLQGRYDTGGNDFTVTGPTRLDDTVINTSKGKITFNGTVDAAVPGTDPDLVLSSGTGVVSFNKIVGAKGRLGTVTATNATSVTVRDGKAEPIQLVENFERKVRELPDIFKAEKFFPAAPDEIIVEPGDQDGPDSPKPGTGLERQTDPNRIVQNRLILRRDTPARIVDASPVAVSQTPLVALTNLETLSEIAPGAGPEGSSETIVITESDAEAIEEALDVIVETCPDVVLTSLAWQNTPADAAFSLKPTVVPYSVDEYCAGYLMTYPGRGATEAYQGLSFVTRDFWTDLEQSRDEKVIPALMPSFGLGARERMGDIVGD